MNGGKIVIKNFLEDTKDSKYRVVATEEAEREKEKHRKKGKRWKTEQQIHFFRLMLVKPANKLLSKNEKGMQFLTRFIKTELRKSDMNQK